MLLAKDGKNSVEFHIFLIKVLVNLICLQTKLIAIRKVSESSQFGLENILNVY